MLAAACQAYAGTTASRLLCRDLSAKTSCLMGGIPLRCSCLMACGPSLSATSTAFDAGRVARSCFSKCDAGEAIAVTVGEGPSPQSSATPRTDLRSPRRAHLRLFALSSPTLGHLINAERAAYYGDNIKQPQKPSRSRCRRAFFECLRRLPRWTRSENRRPASTDRSLRDDTVSGYCTPLSPALLFCGPMQRASLQMPVADRHRNIGWQQREFRSKRRFGY